MPRIKFKDREWVIRWKAKSPEYFLKFQNVGVKLTVLGGLLCFIPPLLPVGTAISGAGVAMASVAKLTKKDATKEDVDKLKAELEILKAKLN